MKFIEIDKNVFVVIFNSHSKYIGGICSKLIYGFKFEIGSFYTKGGVNEVLHYWKYRHKMNLKHIVKNMQIECEEDNTI